jgi:L-ascorbate metabolism protein UlaG (beta-lactamase superfamily)
MIEKLSWLGHASFKIKGKTKVVYIDPWKLKGSHEPADIILIGHSHYDHLSVPDVEKVQKQSTVIITTADCASGLKGNIRIIKPGSTVVVDDVTVQAIPAYNVNKAFHPKSNEWVGFILTLDGERLYYASDTDFIPEMKELQNIDIALLPIGGTYTMNANEAAQAAKTINPRIVVPYHYGDIIGTKEDAKRLASLYTGETRILNPT